MLACQGWRVLTTAVCNLPESCQQLSSWSLMAVLFMTDASGGEMKVCVTQGLQASIWVVGTMGIHHLLQRLSFVYVCQQDLYIHAQATAIPALS